VSSILTILIAFLGGLVPALLWLWFWLKEDKKNPEPKSLIAFAFIVGAVSVAIAIPLEKWVLVYISGISSSITTLVIIFWATIEESLKLIAGYLTVLKRKEMNEPIDAIIYMISIALGFAAMENILFIFNAFEGSVFSIFTTGSFRFIGATLLHILSSATIGGAIALSFYKSKIKKVLYVLIGTLLAFLIHTLFNIFINSASNVNILTIFSFVWAGIILLILFFEKVRTIKKKKRLNFDA